MTSSEIQSNVYGNHIKLTDAASELLSEHSHLDLTERVQLVDESIRGHGGCADVYCGRLMDSGKYVAVKRLRVHFQKEQQLSKACYTFRSLRRYVSLTNILQNISRELRIWSLLNHPNVLPLLGYTLHGGSTFAFISEYMMNGTAWEYLKLYPETDKFQMV
jgi:serine/threonine protein kinase